MVNIPTIYGADWGMVYGVVLPTLWTFPSPTVASPGLQVAPALPELRKIVGDHAILCHHLGTKEKLRHKWSIPKEDMRKKEKRRNMGRESSCFIQSDIISDPTLRKFAWCRANKSGMEMPSFRPSSVIATGPSSSTAKNRSCLSKSSWSMFQKKSSH